MCYGVANCQFAMLIGNFAQYPCTFLHYSEKVYCVVLNMNVCISVNSAAQQQQARGMATLKAISIRLKSVKNIQKITQSMKMVSAAKYARAERELKQARPYGEGATVSRLLSVALEPSVCEDNDTLSVMQQFYERAEVTSAEEKPSKLIVAVTSDRGLCGAVHSGVARHIRSELATDDGSTKVVCIGDKSRALLQR